MDGWLPPHAPGAKPPPRFDAAPPAPAAAEPEPPPSPPTAERAAPGGWQPPVAPRTPPPRSAGAGPSRTEDGGASPGAAGSPRSGEGDTAQPLWSGPRSPGPTEPTRLGAGRPAERPPIGPAAAANPAAVWALIFGITGLIVLVLSLGFGFLLALPCSAAAWFLARRAAARIARGESGRGAGQAQAALWLGRIGTVASVAAMIAFIALSVLGYDFEALRDNLQQELERRRDGAR
jgi:hypothetical protein